MTMPAISLHQPWASLVAVGAKPFETRSWAPPASLIGKRIAIHAAKKPVWPNVVDLDSATLEAMESALGVHGDPFWPKRMPLGAVVCTAVLAGAYACDLHEHARLPGSRPLERIPADLFGDYSPGRWAWLLTDIEKLDPPVPAKGAQGFFTWTPSLAEAA
jgi:hypothetical protein